MAKNYRIAKNGDRFAVKLGETIVSTHANKYDAAASILDLNEQDAAGETEHLLAKSDGGAASSGNANTATTTGAAASATISMDDGLTAYDLEGQNLTQRDLKRIEVAMTQNWSGVDGDAIAKDRKLKDSPKFQRCLKHVEAQGHDAGSAHAICYNALTGTDKAQMPQLTKAALTRWTKFLHFNAIQKADADQHLVIGLASSEAIDGQDEIVDANAIKEALADFMKWANLREMHQNLAVGTVLKAEPVTGEVMVDGVRVINPLRIEAKVLDAGAWEKVKQGIYKGFSIGGKVLDSVVEKVKDDVTGMFKEVRRITKLALTEISLVDRPANPDAAILVWKRAEDDGATDSRPALRKTTYAFDVEGKRVDLAALDDFYAFNEQYPIQNNAGFRAVVESLMLSELEKRKGGQAKTLRLTRTKTGARAQMVRDSDGLAVGQDVSLTLYEKIARPRMQKARIDIRPASERGSFWRSSVQHFLKTWKKKINEPEMQALAQAAEELDIDKAKSILHAITQSGRGRWPDNMRVDAGFLEREVESGKAARPVLTKNLTTGNHVAMRKVDPRRLKLLCSSWEHLLYENADKSSSMSDLLEAASDLREVGFNARGAKTKETLYPLLKEFILNGMGVKSYDYSIAGISERRSALSQSNRMGDRFDEPLEQSARADLRKFSYTSADSIARFLQGSGYATTDPEVVDFLKRAQKLIDDQTPDLEWEMVGGDDSRHARLQLVAQGEVVYEVTAEQKTIRGRNNQRYSARTYGSSGYDMKAPPSLRQRPLANAARATTRKMRGFEPDTPERLQRDVADYEDRARRRAAELKSVTDALEAESDPSKKPGLKRLLTIARKDLQSAQDLVEQTKSKLANFDGEAEGETDKSIRPHLRKARQLCRYCGAAMNKTSDGHTGGDSYTCPQCQATVETPDTSPYWIRGNTTGAKAARATLTKGQPMPKMSHVNLLRKAMDGKANSLLVEDLQKSRNVAEAAGDANTAALLTQAIALVAQLRGEPGVALKKAAAPAPVIAVDDNPHNDLPIALIAPPVLGEIESLRKAEGEEPDGDEDGTLPSDFDGDEPPVMDDATVLHTVIRALAQMLADHGDAMGAKVVSCYAPQAGMDILEDTGEMLEDEELGETPEGEEMGEDESGEMTMAARARFSKRMRKANDDTDSNSELLATIRRCADFASNNVAPQFGSYGETLRQLHKAVSEGDHENAAMLWEQFNEDYGTDTTANTFADYFNEDLSPEMSIYLDDINASARPHFRKGAIDQARKADKSLGSALSNISDAQNAIGGEGYASEKNMLYSLSTARTQVADVRQTLRDEAARMKSARPRLAKTESLSDMVVFKEEGIATPEQWQSFVDTLGFTPRRWRFPRYKDALDLIQSGGFIKYYCSASKFEYGDDKGDPSFLVAGTAYNASDQKISDLPYVSINEEVARKFGLTDATIAQLSPKTFNEKMADIHDESEKEEATRGEAMGLSARPHLRKLGPDIGGHSRTVDTQSGAKSLGSVLQSVVKALKQAGVEATAIGGRVVARGQKDVNRVRALLAQAFGTDRADLFNYNQQGNGVMVTVASQKAATAFLRKTVRSDFQKKHGDSALTEVVYSVSQDGTDEETGNSEEGGWYGLLIGKLTEEEVTEAGHTLDELDEGDMDYEAFIIFENSQGFNKVTPYATEAEARTAWKDEVLAGQAKDEEAVVREPANGVAKKIKAYLAENPDSDAGDVADALENEVGDDLEIGTPDWLNDVLTSMAQEIIDAGGEANDAEPDADADDYEAAAVAEVRKRMDERKAEFEMNRYLNSNPELCDDPNALAEQFARVYSEEEWSDNEMEWLRQLARKACDFLPGDEPQVKSARPRFRKGGIRVSGSMKNGPVKIESSDGRFSAVADVYSEPSHYGIKGGKISRLQINDNDPEADFSAVGSKRKDNRVFSWDRGPDVDNMDEYNDSADRIAARGFYTAILERFDSDYKAARPRFRKALDPKLQQAETKLDRAGYNLRTTGNAMTVMAEGDTAAKIKQILGDLAQFFSVEQNGTKVVLTLAGAKSARPQMKKDNRRFGRGTGVYTCKECGKQTRDTGGGEASVELCRKCYEVNLVENSISDGDLSEEEGQAAIAAIESKYGKSSRPLFHKAADERDISDDEAAFNTAAIWTDKKPSFVNGPEGGYIHIPNDGWYSLNRKSAKQRAKELGWAGDVVAAGENETEAWVERQGRRYTSAMADRFDEPLETSARSEFRKRAARRETLLESSNSRPLKKIFLPSILQLADRFNTLSADASDGLKALIGGGRIDAIDTTVLAEINQFLIGLGPDMEGDAKQFIERIDEYLKEQAATAATEGAQAAAQTAPPTPPAPTKDEVLAGKGEGGKTEEEPPSRGKSARAMTRKAEQGNSEIELLNKTVQELQTRLADIESQPMPGGPVLRPVSKTLPTMPAPRAGQPLTKNTREWNGVEYDMDELRRLANTEPNIALRQDYIRKLNLIEGRG